MLITMHVYAIKTANAKDKLIMKCFYSRDLFILVIKLIKLTENHCKLEYGSPVRTLNGM